MGILPACKVSPFGVRYGTVLMIKFLPFRQKITNNTCCCIDWSNTDLPTTPNSESSNSICFSTQKSPLYFSTFYSQRWEMTPKRTPALVWCTNTSKAVWFTSRNRCPSSDLEIFSTWYICPCFYPHPASTGLGYYCPTVLTDALDICFKVSKCLDTPTGTKELKGFVAHGCVVHFCWEWHEKYTEQHTVLNCKES